MIVKSNELEFKLVFSDGIKRYFRSDRLWFKYDQEIQSVNKSILSIPALGAVIAVAWGVGADVYLETIDSRFLESLEKVKQVFRKWFPKFSFSTQIHVNRIVAPGTPTSKKHALLFSGGLDALCSYIKHREDRLTLVTIRWNIPLEEQLYYELFKAKVNEFAKREGAKILFAETNELDLTNNELSARDFLGKPDGGSWYGDVTHGMLLVTAAAPLLENYETILLASSDFKDQKNPQNIGTQGSLVFHEVEVFISNTKVVYDSPEFTRIGKIRKYLKPNPEYASGLVVCNSENRFFKPSTEFLNCCVCEKCLRTILGLVSENIDPSTCNFPLRRTKDTLGLIKTQLKSGVLATDWTVGMEWEATQSNTDERLAMGQTNDMPGATEFFQWFVTYDFRKINRSPVSILMERTPLAQLLYCYSIISTRQRDLKFVVSFLGLKVKQRFAK
ncbi:MAG TPA: hypothetical protein VMD05_04190 [Candidatus Nanoarchaeia archaeon]|nr:hypothetical protein [Candidatus Nanoarchaeia archaeon]